MRAQLAAILIALALSPSLATAQEIPGITLQNMPAQTISIVMGTSRSIVTDRPYSTIQIIDPTIFDVVPESDRRLNLVPKSPGLTTMVIFDKDNHRMSEANVIVQRIPRVADTETDETYRGVPGRVKIHNDPKGLAGVSFYSCTPNCDLIKEKQAAFQAPPPQPVAQQNDVSVTGRDPQGNLVTTRRSVRVGP